MDDKRRWEDEHWLWRGFQSAVFLYAQCGPCIAFRDSRRQKKQYKREKKERAKYPDHPNAIRQPAPHEINPHWEEEIRLGPAPPKKGRKRGNTKSSRDTASSGTLVASETGEIGASDLIDKDKIKFWNPRRYQRADEEFTYVDSVEEPPRMVYSPLGLNRRGSSVGVNGWGLEGKQLPKKPPRVYTPPSNMPPVNELHPPIISSMPAKKEDRAWMKAPPPSAAFMHGKKGVTTRSRSGSGNSSARNDDFNLGRHVGQKIVEEKIKNGERATYGTEIVPLSDRVDSKLQDEGGSEPSEAPQRTHSTCSFRLAREKQPSPFMKTRRRPAPLRLNSDNSTTSAKVKNPSEAESEMSSESCSSSLHRGRSKTTYHPITKSKRVASSALNSHPISPPPQDTTAATSLASQVSLGLSPSSTLRPPRDSATPTPLTASPRVIDNYTPSPRKRKDTKVSSDGQAPLFVKDSSLHILQDVVDPSALLNSRRIRSPVIEANLPLPPGDSPRKENESPVKLIHGSAKEQLLLEGARRWSWGM
jgi:hypothetical protein